MASAGMPRQRAAAGCCTEHASLAACARPTSVWRRSGTPFAFLSPCVQPIVSRQGHFRHLPDAPRANVTTILKVTASATRRKVQRRSAANRDRRIHARDSEVDSKPARA